MKGFGRQLDRKGSSEKLRTGSILRAGASHEKDLRKLGLAAMVRKDQSKMSQTALGGKVQEGVRVCLQGHDARTASEHLAPFPVPQSPQPRHRLQIRSGARLPLATKPHCQRQLMQYRVHAPVREQLHRAAPQINQMSREGATKPQHLPIRQ